MPEQRTLLEHAAIGLLGCAAGAAAVNVAALVDPDRLVQISSASILQAVLFAVFLYSVGLLLILRWKDVPGALALFSVAFGIRAVLAIVLAMLFQFDDERILHAAGIAQIYGTFSYRAGSAYYLLVNWLYALWGPNILLPKMVNVLFGSVLPFLTFDLASCLYRDERASRRAMLFAAFLPPLVIFSAVNLKEMLTAFLLTLAVWLAVAPRWHAMAKSACIAAVVAYLYWLRDAAWATIALLGVATFFVLDQNWSLVRLRRPPVLVRTALALLAALVLAFVLGPPLRQLIQSRTTQETYFISRFTESRATVTQFLSLGNPLAPRNLVVLLLRGLFAPTPLRVALDYGLHAILESPVMLVWYVLAPFAVLGVLSGYQRGGVVASALIVIGVLGLATGGIMVGSDPYRHRIALFGVFLALAAGGSDPTISQRYRYVHAIWWSGALVFTALWAVLRI